MADNTQQSLDSLEKKLNQQIESASSAKTITIAAYVVLIVIFSGYLTWLRSMVIEMTNKESLVLMATQAIERQIPAIRRAAVAEIRTRGPELINESVDELVAFIPEGRQELMKEIDRRMDAEADYLQARIEALVDTAIDEHKADIEALAATLATENGREAFANFIYDLITVQVADPQVAPEIEAYGEVLDGVAARMERLQRGEFRDSSDRVEHHLIVALKEISLRSPRMEQLQIPLGDE
ncbi:MAG: hypothetical protein SF028_12025 [Candidatus Sumerlaeia bacterium]|nr:hypothetical protein [Candidatus Sumerlaeia bacterium]